jgi:hypothetical protein
MAFFWELWSIEAFCLLARVCEALAPDPVEGPWEDSTLGLQAEIGVAWIGISPSNPGMGEVKLSKSCIQIAGM